MPVFPSEEWIKRFQDKLNNNPAYQEAAADWEGDFLFVIMPDGAFDDTVAFYVDLWHGSCREARLVEGDEKAAFTFAGPYGHWKQVIDGKLDPLRGLITGMFRLEGDSQAVMNNVRAAQELVNTVARIPTEFRR